MLVAVVGSAGDVKENWQSSGRSICMMKMETGRCENCPVITLTPTKFLQIHRKERR